MRMIGMLYNIVLVVVCVILWICCYESTSVFSLMIMMIIPTAQHAFQPKALRYFGETRVRVRCM